MTDTIMRTERLGGALAASHAFSTEMRKLGLNLAPNVLHFVRKVQYRQAPVARGLAWIPC